MSGLTGVSIYNKNLQKQLSIVTTKLKVAMDNLQLIAVYDSCDHEPEYERCPWERRCSYDDGKCIETHDGDHYCFHMIENHNAYLKYLDVHPDEKEQKRIKNRSEKEIAAEALALINTIEGGSNDNN